MPINLKKQTQIEIKAQIKALIFDKTPIIILVELSNYNNIFSAKYKIEFLENIRIYNYTIKLKKDK